MSERIRNARLHRFVLAHLVTVISEWAATIGTLVAPRSNVTRQTSMRIVSLLSSATEVLYGLGLGDSVVAVSHECDFPAEVKTKPEIIPNLAYLIVGDGTGLA